MSFDLALVEGDLKIQSDGSIKTVANTPKLKQDLIKLIQTEIGSNKYHPWYGCTVSDDIIGQHIIDDIIFADLQSSITQGLERLKTLQISQASTQNVTLSEMIGSIGEVNAYRSLEDARMIVIDVTVYSRRFDEIQETFKVSP
jgi:phage baseplate assembly protein W